MTRTSRHSATAAILVAAAIVLSVAAFAGAAVIHIPVDQLTITEGLAAASAGDTLLLATDGYHEHGMYIDKAVTIASEAGGPGYVDIYGDLAGRIFWVENATGVVFSGVTLRTGQSNWGSAVYADSSDVTFDNCVLTQNHAAMEGGAIFYNRGSGTFTGCNIVVNDAVYGGGGVVVNAADCTFTSCYFGDNQARWGGGVAIVHLGATPTFTDCTFQENHAVGTEPYGGGVYCWDYATPTFTDCDFIMNTSEYGGGGLMSDEECQIVVTGCAFLGNSAEVGGGIETWHTRGGSVTSCEFTGTRPRTARVCFTNRARTCRSRAARSRTTRRPRPEAVSVCLRRPRVPPTARSRGTRPRTAAPSRCSTARPRSSRAAGLRENTAQYGGAVAIQTCDSPAFSYSTFSENTAEYGGALAIAGCSTPSVTGCTLVLNRGTIDGGGIVISTGTTLSVGTTIIAFSSEGEAIASDGEPVSCTTTAVYGNAGGDWVGIIAGQESADNNIATDPLFCGVFQDDYTVCEDSPCLPGNNGAGVYVGANGQGCSAPCGAPVRAQSWGSIKAMYR